MPRKRRVGFQCLPKHSLCMAPFTCFCLIPFYPEVMLQVGETGSHLFAHLGHFWHMSGPPEWLPHVPTHLILISRVGTTSLDFLNNLFNSLVIKWNKHGGKTREFSSRSFAHELIYFSVIVAKVIKWHYQCFLGGYPLVGDEFNLWTGTYN